MTRTLLLITFLTTAAIGRADDKPNILFLFADDQAWHTLGALGNDEIQTPNLDRLFAKGTTFTQTYNPGGWNGAICVASRAMLNTGLSLWDAQKTESKFKKEWVPQKKFWAQQLAAQGYQTFFSGKWHVKADANQVFEHARHIRGGMPKQTPAGYNRPQSPGDTTWQPWDKSFGGFWEGGKHWSEVLGDDAVDYMKIASDDERPFFMYLAFNAPHDPRQSPKEYVDRYPLDSVAVPETFQPLYPYDIGSNRCRDEKLAPFPRTVHSVKVNRQEYYAIITHMDAQIGRILDELKATGEEDSTYIIFTADHGLACGNHGLLGKQNMYDHSVRVPFCIVGPDIEAGRSIGQRMYLQNVMPTTLELAGAEIPEHVSFKSVLPMLNDAKEEITGTVYGGYMMVQRMVTVGNDKLICYPKEGVSLLFDLKSDPLEMNDLSNRNGSLAVKKRLFSELLKQQKAFNDPLDLKETFSELL